MSDATGSNALRNIVIIIKIVFRYHNRARDIYQGWLMIWSDRCLPTYLNTKIQRHVIEYFVFISKLNSQAQILRYVLTTYIGYWRIICFCRQSNDGKYRRNERLNWNLWSSTQAIIRSMELRYLSCIHICRKPHRIQFN